MVVQFIVSLTLSALICRGTDISKCFRESLGIRDNEVRLYVDSKQYFIIKNVRMLVVVVLSICKKMSMFADWTGCPALMFL